MKKSFWLTLALGLTLATGGVLVLNAQDANGGTRWRSRGWANAKDKLGLSDAQIATIKAEIRVDQVRLVELARRQHDAKVALRTTIKRAGASDAEIRAAGAALGAAEGEMAVVKAQIYTRVRPVLTAEQLDKIAAWEQKIDEVVDGAIAAFISKLVE